YRSDMTRTVALGEITEEQRRVYDLVLEAQLRALDAVAAGKTGREIDKVARDIIDGAGYKGCFGHGLGHSVGLYIHEEPRFSPSCPTVMEEGMVITVEPGIYLEGRFGVRIEDLVVITAQGCENLTKSAKQLIVL
ncbi:MAG: M24 family metallopeptidase, partial [Candidatus Pacebacteria bacterium]|nr:M24 family metallopeptidase [Candidatus Paceibacterota bacterium]